MTVYDGMLPLKIKSVEDECRTFRLLSIMSMRYMTACAMQYAASAAHLKERASVFGMNNVSIEVVPNE